MSKGCLSSSSHSHASKRYVPNFISCVSPIYHYNNVMGHLKRSCLLDQHIIIIHTCIEVSFIPSPRFLFLTRSWANRHNNTDQNLIMASIPTHRGYAYNQEDMCVDHLSWSYISQTLFQGPRQRFPPSIMSKDLRTIACD